MLPCSANLVYSDIYTRVCVHKQPVCGSYSVYNKNRCWLNLLTRGLRKVLCAVSREGRELFWSRLFEKLAYTWKRNTKKEKVKKRRKVDDPLRKASVKWRWSVLRLALSDRRGSRLLFTFKFCFDSLVRYLSSRKLVDSRSFQIIRFTFFRSCEFNFFSYQFITKFNNGVSYWPSLK